MSSHSVQPQPSETPGSWLNRQIERRKISVRQFADALDVTTQTVYDWRGDRATVQETRVPRIAAVLGVSELEARRGLGYWVPEGQGDEPPAMDRGELEQIRADLLGVLERLDRLQRGE